jgi:hypothetical protein
MKHALAIAKPTFSQNEYTPNSQQFRGHVNARSMFSWLGKDRVTAGREASSVE